MKDIDQIYDYLDITFLSNLHESKWQDEDFNDASKTLADKTHVLLGVARLRQLRVRTGEKETLSVSLPIYHL